MCGICVGYCPAGKLHVCVGNVRELSSRLVMCRKCAEKYVGNTRRVRPNCQVKLG